MPKFAIKKPHLSAASSIESDRSTVRRRFASDRPKGGTGRFSARTNNLYSTEINSKNYK